MLGLSAWKKSVVRIVGVTRMNGVCRKSPDAATIAVMPSPRVGQTVKTLPSVHPAKYAGKEGVVTIADNDGEVQVRIGGSLAWFRHSELDLESTAPQASEMPGLSAPAAIGTFAREVVECPSCGSKRDARTGQHFEVSPTTRACEAVTKPGRAGTGPGGGSEPAAPLAAPTTSQRPMAGTRGPGGGIVARCEACGETWERPKQRGRPSFRCGECR